MNAELSLMLDNIKRAENHAFKAMLQAITSYKRLEYENIYEKLKKFRGEIEDDICPSERMVDVRVLVLRDEGQEVRL